MGKFDKNFRTPSKNVGDIEKPNYPKNIADPSRECTDRTWLRSQHKQIYKVCNNLYNQTTKLDRYPTLIEIRKHMRVEAALPTNPE